MVIEVERTKRWVEKREGGCGVKTVLNGTELINPGDWTTTVHSSKNGNTHRILNATKI